MKDVRGPAEAFGRFVGRKDELRRVGEVLAAATKRNGARAHRPRRPRHRQDPAALRGRAPPAQGRLQRGLPRRGVPSARRRVSALGHSSACCRCSAAPPRATRRSASLAVQPRLRALGPADRRGERGAHRAGRSRAGVLGQREGAAPPGLRPHGAEPLRGPPAHLRVGRGARDGRGQLRPAGRGAAAAAARRASSSRSRRAPGSRTRSSASPATSALDLGDLAAPDVERLVALRLGVDTRARRAPAVRAGARRRAPALRRGGHQGPRRRATR